MADAVQRCRLSYSTVEKTFYSFFVYGDLLTTPFNYRLEEGDNPRRLEIEQIIRLMNIIAEKIYVGKFDRSLGTRRIENNIQKGVEISDLHLCAFRMAKEEVIYNWLRYIRQIVQHHFINMGEPIDEERLFQYPIPDSCWENIEKFISALQRLPLWIKETCHIRCLAQSKITTIGKRSLGVDVHRTELRLASPRVILDTRSALYSGLG